MHAVASLPREEVDSLQASNGGDAFPDSSRYLGSCEHGDSLPFFGILPIPARASVNKLQLCVVVFESPNMPKRKPVGFDDLAERARNVRALLDSLLGPEAVKAARRPSLFLSYLAFRRAARVKGGAKDRALWLKVHFLLQMYRAERGDALAYQWLRDLGHSKAVRRVEKLLEAYAAVELRARDLVESLGEMDDRKLTLEQRLRVSRIAKLAHEEFSYAMHRRVEFCGLGQPSLERRAYVALLTRVGFGPSQEVNDRRNIEEKMEELGFSQSEIAMLMDGPGGSAKERGRKVAKRASYRRKLKSPENDLSISGDSIL